MMTMVRKYACMLSYRPGRVTHMVHDYVSDMFFFYRMTIWFIHEYFHVDACTTLHNFYLLSFSSCSSCDTG